MHGLQICFFWDGVGTLSVLLLRAGYGAAQYAVGGEGASRCGLLR